MLWELKPGKARLQSSDSKADSKTDSPASRVDSLSTVFDASCAGRCSASMVLQTPRGSEPLFWDHGLQFNWLWSVASWAL